MLRNSIFIALVVIGVSAGSAQAQIIPDATAYQEAIKQANELSAQLHEFQQMNAAIGSQHPSSASDVAKLNAVVQQADRAIRGFGAISRGRDALGING